jgi:4-hydroxy-3-methylbut-2-enyl diphosphate reductase
MPREFDVPDFYRSPIIARVKMARRAADPRKRNLAPSVLDFGPVRLKLARHFGFCYGVENAIEIAYRALAEHPDKAAEGRVFLLSEMIHNPHVNADLEARGIRFLRTTLGEQLIPFDELRPDDVVIIPAFGASRDVEADLRSRGLDPGTYDTTCPFVERVWKKSAQIGDRAFTIVVHGKRYHEETRATFSHAQAHAPVVVVRDLEEAEVLAGFVRGEYDLDEFERHFGDRTSEGFDPSRDLQRIGVVNQTTMLATETAAIAALMRQAMIERFGAGSVEDHFADTTDTLCYATKENQDATLALIADGADLALVVGGYNSSNTSHLVELCEGSMPTYFIEDADEILSESEIRHFDWRAKRPLNTQSWLPSQRPVDILLTAGASCPDAMLDSVIHRVLTFFPGARSVEEALEPFAPGSPVT